MIEAFKNKVVMTGSAHPSGTDRCYEALQKIGGNYKYVINIQGDEPFIDPLQIDELAAALKDDSIELATQMIKVKSQSELFDRGEVKIVLNHTECSFTHPIFTSEKVPGWSFDNTFGNCSHRVI